MVGERDNQPESDPEVLRSHRPEKRREELRSEDKFESKRRTEYRLAGRFERRY